MNKTLEITNIDLQVNNNISEITYSFRADEKEYKLKYIITGFQEFCEDTYEYRIDSFVTTFLVHAMKGGYNFSSKYPMSRKLYYHILWHIVPQIHFCNKNNTHLIEIDAPLCDDRTAGNYIGTGFSCGLDSFSTVFEYTELMPIKEYKITHLFYNKVGAHDGQIGRFDNEVETQLFKDQLAKAIHTSELLNLPLIIVESNLNEVLDAFFGFTWYEQTHTIRNIGVIYLFQQFFSHFYYADAFNLDQFKVNVNSSMAYYEKWLLPLLSNERISFYSANKAMTRVEKVKLLAEFPLSYDNLLVCFTHGKNCGKCRKCKLTQITMDIMGTLDLYKNSFDLEEYYRHRDTYITTIPDEDCDVYTYYLKPTNHPLLLQQQSSKKRSNPNNKREVSESSNRYKQELDAVYSSASWRLGNFLIQPFHFIKKILKK